MRMRLMSALWLAAAFAVPAGASAQVTDREIVDLAAAAVQGYVSFTIFDDVSIAVSNRAVTLTGRVTMPFKRDDLAKRIAAIDGVRSVANNITVLPVSLTDAALRARVARAIYSNQAFWHYAEMANPPIHVIVEYGRVTLTGCVNNQVERMLAYSLAQVDGVFSVKNELRLDKD
jgi:hyperosmotically inducible protein